MGMGGVGKTQSIMLTAQRVKRKVIGEKVRKIKYFQFMELNYSCVFSLAECVWG